MGRLRAKPSRRASHGLECLGVINSSVKCKRSRRPNKNLPVVLTKVCSKCGEQRCKKHCKCGRSGTALGRSAPRGDDVGKGVGRTLQVQARTPSAVVVAPVGRASEKTSCEVLDDATELYERCCSDLKKASVVEVASYCYDSPAVQQVLLARLKGSAPFAVNLYIDKEMYAGKVPKRQKRCLRELEAAGAAVYICKGLRGLGSFHWKAMIVDRRYMYTGSANFSKKSLDNEELCFRMTGPVVTKVLTKLLDIQSRAARSGD